MWRRRRGRGGRGWEGLGGFDGASELVMRFMYAGYWTGGFDES